jgi:hypothetical protein
MTFHVLIANVPVVDIYEADDGRCWFVTEKVFKYGQWFLSGYVRCIKTSTLAEFCNMPEELIEDSVKHIWKVKKDAWSRCPCVDVQDDTVEPEIIPCTGCDTKTQPLASCSISCKEVDDKMDDTKKLKRYLELYSEISKTIESEAVALAILTEISKDRRAEQMRKDRDIKNGDAVTFKQKRCMQNLGIDFPENITRKEASVLIQEELERLNGVGE